MLEIINVHASYGKYEILKGATLHVNQGEIVCMIGPNGAGKSTVFRTIFGFLKPLQGQIIFKGESIAGAPTHKIIKKGISYVFQRHSVFPNMTVMENLEMGAYIRHDREKVKKEIEELFELFPILKERRNEAAKNMSGGQRRMLEIARGLLIQPELLLLDEPTLGLSPIIQKMIFKKLKKINKMGLTIMIVEQNARLALEHSRRAYVLENGRIILEGSGPDLLQDPKVVKAYLGGKTNLTSHKRINTQK